VFPPAPEATAWQAGFRLPAAHLTSKCVLHLQAKSTLSPCIPCPARLRCRPVMRATGILATILAISLAACAIAAEQHPLEKYKATYEKELAAIQQTYSDHATACRETCLKGLVRVQDALRKAGNLDGVQAVIQEKERFLAGSGDIPQRSLSDVKELRAVQDWYLASMDKATAARAKKHVALANRYESVLTKLMQKLTIAGDLEKALEAKKELGRIQSDPKIATARNTPTGPIEKKEQNPPADRQPRKTRSPDPAPVQNESENLVANSGFDEGKRKWRLEPGMKIVDDPDPAPDDTEPDASGRQRPSRRNKVVRIPLSEKDTTTIAQGLNVKVLPRKVKIRFRIRFGEDAPGRTIRCKEKFTRKRNTATISHRIKISREWQLVDLVTTGWWDEKTSNFEIEFPKSQGTVWLDDITVTPIMD
jgi:hypothetical protein